MLWLINFSLNAVLFYSTAINDSALLFIIDLVRFEEAILVVLRDVRRERDELSVKY